jgi:hypothetical protein
MTVILAFTPFILRNSVTVFSSVALVCNKRLKALFESRKDNYFKLIQNQTEE